MQQPQTFLQRGFEGDNIWYKFVLGVILVLIGIILFQLAPISILSAIRVGSGALDQELADKAMELGDFSMLGVSNNLVLILLIAGFIGGLAGLWLAVRYLHGKRFLSIVTASRQLRWRRVLGAFGIWVLFTAVAEIFLYVLDPGNYTLTFSAPEWIGLVFIAIFLLPLQTTFEEVFMRGYLMQGLGLLTRKPWIAVILTSFLFGTLHFANPEVRQFGVWIMMTYYIGVGLFLAIVTVLDGGLEIALGIHAATNIYGAVFVNFSGSAITTDAMFMVSEVNAGMLLAFFLLSMAIFLIVGTRLFAWDWSMLFNRIVEPENYVISDDIQ